MQDIQKSIIMETILWSQDSKSTGVSRFVIDGVVSKYESKENQDSAYAFLSSIARKIKPTREYPKLSVFRKGIFIEGYFNEKDESGRYMTFMFFHPDKDIKAAIKLLYNYSELIGCSVNPSIENKLESEFVNNKKRRIRNVTLATIVILSISILLLILKNQ